MAVYELKTYNRGARPRSEVIAKTREKKRTKNVSISKSDIHGKFES